MSKDHNAHILRADLNEWCGGTEPPTTVTVRPEHDELQVDIYPAGSNLHVGEVVERVDTREFLLKPGTNLGPTEIGEYAIRAIGAIEAEAKTA